MPRHTTTAAAQHQVHDLSVGIAVDLALSELNTGLTGADADDLKAFALLAVDLAAVAVVVSVREALNRYWYWIIVGFALSATLVAAALWRHLYDGGPDSRRFLQETVDATDAQYVTTVAVMSLALARDHNKMLRRYKGRLYTASLVTFIVTAAGGAAFLLGVH